MTTSMTPGMPAVLLVDDEPEILFSSSVILGSAIPNPLIAVSDSSEVLHLLERDRVAVIVLDLQMPGISGHELLQRIRYEYPHISIIVMTASNTIESAVECMKLGACDYLVKPVEKSRLVSSVLRSMEVNRLRDEVSSLKQHLLTGELRCEKAFEPIITKNRKMRALFQYVETIAASSHPVLITGETGVGKELFARAIHDVSGRKGQFVAVNVAGVDDHTFTDTLFGHRKGAFTGADQPRPGLIAQAAGGTFFLDEIGDLSPLSQIKLLRLLQENEYYPLGSDVPKKSDIRVVAATNVDLQQKVHSGGFRKDLYYRLCTHSCQIPPLRERLDDLPVLLEHFVAMAAESMNKEKPLCPGGLVGLLATCRFEGNVRELQSVVHDAVARTTLSVLPVSVFTEKLRGLSCEPERAAVAQAMGHQDNPVLFHSFPTLKEAEEELIAKALTIGGGNQGVAASMLGITRQALNNRLIRKQRS